MLTPEQYQALNNAVEIFDKFIQEHPEVVEKAFEEDCEDFIDLNDIVFIESDVLVIQKEQALEAMERIFNYCEEIDLHIPEDERTGYNMLPDVQLVERYIMSKEN